MQIYSAAAAVNFIATKKIKTIIEFKLLRLL